MKNAPLADRPNSALFGPKLEFLEPRDDCISLPRPDGEVPQSMFAYFIDAYWLGASGSLFVRPLTTETAPLASEMDDERELWSKMLRLRLSVVGIMLVDPVSPWVDALGYKRKGILELKSLGRLKTEAAFEAAGQLSEDEQSIADREGQKDAEAERVTSVSPVNVGRHILERRNVASRRKIEQKLNSGPMATEMLLIIAPVEQREAWLIKLLSSTDATVTDIYEITPDGLRRIDQGALYE